MLLRLVERVEVAELLEGEELRWLPTLLFLLEWDEPRLLLTDELLRLSDLLVLKEPRFVEEPPVVNSLLPLEPLGLPEVEECLLLSWRLLSCVA